MTWITCCLVEFDFKCSILYKQRRAKYVKYKKDLYSGTFF